MDHAHENGKGDSRRVWPEARSGTARAQPAKSADTGYPIGVVSRLTGIQPSTLRMWERRYGLVDPGRTVGRSRRYNDDDIYRLVLVKSLVDAGHQIGTVAAMTIEELKARLEAVSRQSFNAAKMVSPRSRVALLGGTFAERIEAGDALSQHLDVVATFRNETEFAQSAGGVAADVLILECATIHADAPAKVRRLLAACGAQHVVVVYGFGSRQALADLASIGAACLRAPADKADLVRVCSSFRVAAHAGRRVAEDSAEKTVPPPRFTSEQLARISAMAPAIVCECPHHLVDLINSMAAFEAYSRECENRNAEDAEIHVMLSTTAGRSRALLESALQRVADFEGIELD